MDKKKAGIIIAILCVIIAISFCACKSIKIKRKTTSDVNTSEVSSNADSTQQQSNSVDNTSNNNQQQNSTVNYSKNTTNNSDTGSTVSNSSSSSSTSSDFAEVNESSINYSVDEETASGVVEYKKVYLSGNSLVHCVGIKLDSSARGVTVQYPCGYSGYNALSEGDKVTVKYKQVTNKTVAIVSVSK